MRCRRCGGCEVGCACAPWTHRNGYGDALLRELSRRFGEEFGKGFFVANLKNFRRFYIAFSDLEKGYALRSE
ncbi:DUF1016 N-terminal domain-containing protein [Desulfoluna sp.]|uniref:DUF1016 N-terminal domain-containing protein n=1 Tax=Desulfoluna sp. TaxID=2045199 RepID=UPI002627D2B9|nr:DUF1016 N-terminal domain-containing protein [Desulfoluna sp.]